MSVKQVKKTPLRLITHDDVASFDMVAKLTDKADRLQKMGV